MRRYVLLYGLIGGVLIAVLKLIEYRWLLVEHSVEIYGGLVAAVFAAAGIWLGRKLTRRTAVASVCYVATWQLIYYKLAPDFEEKYAAYELEKARKSGASEAELVRKRAEQVEFQQMYRNPLANIGITFLEPLPVGLVFCLVTAGVLSRRRRSEAIVTAPS